MVDNGQADENETPIEQLAALIEKAELDLWRNPTYKELLPVLALIRDTALAVEEIRQHLTEQELGDEDDPELEESDAD